MPKSKYSEIWDSLSTESRLRALHHGDQGQGIPFVKTVGRNPKGDDYLVNSKFQKELKMKEQKLANSSFSKLPNNIKKYARQGIHTEGFDF